MRIISKIIDKVVTDKIKPTLRGSRAGFIIIIMALSLLGHSCFSEPQQDPQQDSIPIPGEAESVVQQARDDLAQRLGIDDAAKIAVVAVEAVDWPDTSLGCPEPGMMYAQVITPGYKILLSHEEEIFVYHSNKENRVVYCSREPIS